MDEHVIVMLKTSLFFFSRWNLGLERIWNVESLHVLEFVFIWKMFWFANQSAIKGNPVDEGPLTVRILSIESLESEETVVAKFHKVRPIEVFPVFFEPGDELVLASSDGD
jgi:hypothetical protein